MRRVYMFVVLCCVTGPSLAAPVPVKKAIVVKDRKTFVPYRQYFPLGEKVVGLLVSDVRAMMGQEGRSGPPNAMAFSADLGSYRWMYVPTEGNALITSLGVPIGKEGKERKVYGKLNMANADEAKRWGIDVPYSLVEVEVNDGAGSPAIEGFVATKIRRLDGTKEFPLNVPEVIERLKQKYANYLTEQEKTIAAKMAEARREAIGDKEATGPRVTEIMLYITWMTETSRLRVHFRTTITDGKFEVQQLDFERPRPLPLPPRPGLPRPQKEQPIAFPPPPPPREKVLAGTSFGVEFGLGYEVTVKGDIDKTFELPYQTFKREQARPPQPRFPTDPVLPRR